MAKIYAGRLLRKGSLQRINRKITGYLSFYLRRKKIRKIIMLLFWLGAGITVFSIIVQKADSLWLTNKIMAAVGKKLQADIRNGSEVYCYVAEEEAKKDFVRQLFETVRVQEKKVYEIKTEKKNKDVGWEKEVHKEEKSNAEKSSEEKSNEEKNNDETWKYETWREETWKDEKREKEPEAVDTVGNRGQFDYNMPGETEQYLPVRYIRGNIFRPVVGENVAELPRLERTDSLRLLLENHYSMEQLADTDYFLSKYYIVDSLTKAVPSLFQAKKLLERDMSLQNDKSEGYQILIYHTHATEGYADSRKGAAEDTVRGAGEYLTKLLSEYGYSVYHDTTTYDFVDGKDNRNYAYSTAKPAIEEFLSKHPEVEVIIDLHRDSGKKRVVELNGKPTAQVMLFNGLCRNTDGPIASLENPNLEGNLAFSLQLNLAGRVLYPDFMYRIYLKNYRYNQHFRERSLLIELGTDENTVEEAYNAMEPLADILDLVLSGKD